MEKKSIIEYFEKLETEEEYDGYYYRVSEAITLVILGSIYELRNVRQIWMWSTQDRIKGFLKEKLQISRILCYYWLLCILRAHTVSLDGKTICSTEKIKNYSSPLHIVRAQLGEMGLAYAHSGWKR